MNIKTLQNRLATEADQATVEQQGGRVLKLGLDVHYRQVTVAMQEDGGRIRVAGKMSHEAFAGWIRKKAAEGWAIFSCYEAGASGYWLHRELETLGVKNLVNLLRAFNLTCLGVAAMAEPFLVYPGNHSASALAGRDDLCTKDPQLQLDIRLRRGRNDSATCPLALL